MKDFKGLVKISDVQNAFDEIVDSINNIIDTYNASAKVLDIDYTKGSSELGASGYTLSVGGLKRIIQTYQGCSVGCKPFKVSTSQCKITAGYVFANNTVYRANEQVLNGSGDVLYYDVTNRRFSFGKNATSSTQTITVPTITNSVSWGNIFASSNSGTAWKAANLTPNANVPWGYQNAWMTPNQNTDWYWQWNFLSPVTGHVKCRMFFFNYTGKSYVKASANGIKNSKTTDLGNGCIEWEFDIENSSYLKYYGHVMGGSWGLAPFLVIAGAQLSNATTTVTIGGDSDAGQLVKICDLNWNRDTKQLATINKAMTESSSRSITIQGKSLPFKANNGYTGNGAFCWATDGEYDGEVRLFGNQISYMSNIGSSRLHYFTIPTYLYIPKGVTNPLSGTIMNTYSAKYKG